ncbi:glycosyltransferase family 4 protein [Candidatus Nitrosoglobus terrae]|uniref:glycosyltransferase family 4 protein n=1 Tax=Candidatus Nitrosoglobus terrae TaxID=1630141 RepID=UPI000BBB61EE
MAQRPLTVLQVLPALESGGVERGTLEVAAELVKQGHRSMVISGGGRLVEDLRQQGSEHQQWSIGVKSPWTLALVLKLRRLLLQQQVDILHVRSRLPAWIAWLAWRSISERARPHFVTTVHGLYSVNRYSQIMTQGERIIAVSETVRRYVLKYYPQVSAKKIAVIPRGVSPEIYSYGYRPDRHWLTDWNTTYPQLQGKIILTLPGRLTRLKGHGDFIVLIERLIMEGYEVHGLIVGEEDPKRRRYIDEIKREVIHKTLQEVVTFIGHRSDMREIYAMSDLVMSLSKKPESFGRTVLEALSLGVPVIGYDHGGVGEILANLFPQGRVPLGDQRALSNRVIEFIKEKPIVPKKQYYTLECMLEKTLQCYSELRYSPS